MKTAINFIGRALSFSFVEKWAVGRGVSVAAAAVVGMLFWPGVADVLPAPLPGDPAAWDAFFQAVLAGVYAWAVKNAKHYGEPRP